MPEPLPRDTEIRVANLATFASGSLGKAKKLSNLQSKNYALPEFCINLHTNHQAFIQYCDESFALQERLNSTSRTLDIYVCSPTDPLWPTPPAWGSAHYRPTEIDEALKNTGLKVTFFRDDTLWHLFDVGCGLGLQWMAGADAYPPWEKSAPMRVFLHWAYGASPDRCLMHAGTLGVGNKGVMLVGKGGSGKSGTVVAGILNGMQSVGDDYILIDRLAGRIIAKPLYRTMKQDRKGVDRLNLHAHLKTDKTLNWQDKFEFTAEEITGRPLASELTLGALLVPVVANGERTEFAPLPKMKAMLSLAPSGIHQLPGDRARNAKFCADLVRDLQCFEMRLGTNPAEISASIADFIGRVNG